MEILINFIFKIIMQIHTNLDDFSRSENNFLDYLGLVLNIIAILITWFVTRYYYKKELDRIEIEEKEITELQIDQFKFNIKIITNRIRRQIIDLNPAKIINSDRIINRQSINSDFLEMIDVNTIAKQIHRNEPLKLAEFRDLIYNIGLLSHNTNNLKDIVETFNQRLVRFESGFYIYKNLLYTEYAELTRDRNISTDPNLINFREDDTFMWDYFHLRNNTLNNQEIIKDNLLIDRKKLIEEFILPFLHLTSKHILTESKANYLNQIANTCKTSFDEIEIARNIKARKAEAQRKILIRIYKVLKRNEIKNYP